MFIDLTQAVTDNMPVYPGDSCARLYQTQFIPTNGYSDYCVESNMHVGTHIENLTNLEAIAACNSFQIHAHPLKYQADAAPVRVVAEIAD